MNNILLPSPVPHRDKEISQKGKHQCQELIGARPVPFIREVLNAWASMILMIIFSVHIGNIFITILTIFFIASRINVLGLLIHEQVHYLGIKGKWGDTFTDIFCAFPLFGITVAQYSSTHLAHHRHFFTERDPDLRFKTGDDWTFPQSNYRLVKLFIKDLFGFSCLGIIKSKKFEPTTRRHQTPGWIRPIMYTTLLITLTLFDLWGVFLLYWVLPLVTVLPVIIRLGRLTEHIYVKDGELEQTTPIIMNTWYEKILLPNLNFTLHLYHHYHPVVSFSNLPKIHKIYQDEGLLDERNIFNGYIEYLKFIQRKDC